MRDDVAPRPQAPRPRRDPRPARVSIALAAAVLLAFLPVADNAFLAFDDDFAVTANAHVRGGLVPANVAWAFTTFEQANWHPVTWLGHLLNVSLFGLRPGAHHLMSVAWHALAAVLLFLALRRLTGETWPPAFAAALFALHPLRVESVAWAAELKDPLSGCCFMLALLAYARYAARPTLRRYLAVAGALALGLMAKPTLVPLPLLLLLLDFWPLGRLSWRAAAEKLPLLALSAAASAVTLRAQAAGGATSNLLVAFPLPVRLENAVVSVAEYLGAFLRPARLSVFYPHPGPALPALVVGLSLALVLALSAFALRLRRTAPYLAAGWLWFLGMLVPVSGIVQAGLQARADRYTYLPAIGLAVALAFAARDLVRTLRPPPWLPRAAAAALLCLLAGATAAQCRHWRTMETLFRHALAVDGRNWYAQMSLGIALAEEGRLDEAVAAYRASLALQPAYGFTAFILGNALRRQGKPAEAIASYRYAVRWIPGKPEVFNNLGSLLAETGALEEGAEQLAIAVRLKPDYAEAAENLRRVRAWLGQRRGGAR